MIDYDEILSEFIRVAQEALGDKLSQTGPSGSPEPTVIRARQGGVKPEYPYVQIDVITTTQTHGWELETGVVEIDGEDVPFIDTHYKITMQYTVYGGNANQLAHELEAYFRLNRVLGDIENNTGGALEATFNLQSLPQSLSTEDLEVAAFNFTFNINDRYTDPQTGVFDHIILDGELARREDDPSPLPLDIDVGPITP